MLNILLLKVVELERRLESISAEFAGQISALKSQLEKERDRRIDLEAEVMFYMNLIPGPYLVGGGGISCPIHNGTLKSFPRSRMNVIFLKSVQF